MRRAKRGRARVLAATILSALASTAPLAHAGGDRGDQGDRGDRVALDLVLATIHGPAPRDAAALEAALGTLASLQSRPGVAGSFELLMARGILLRSLAAERLATPRAGDLTHRELVSPKSEWRLFKGDREVPAEWSTTAFDASAWTKGKGGFGFGDSDDLTVLDDMQGKYSTIFIRRDFVLARGDLERVAGLRLRLWFDDGFVAYINGKEVGRLHAPGRRGTPVAHTGTADSQHEAVEYEDYLVPASHLVVGRNTFALQGINYTVASSDFSLDGALVLVERRETARAEAVARWIGESIDSLERAGDRASDVEARSRAALELAASKILAGDDATAIRICDAIPGSVSAGTRDAAAYLEALVLFRQGRLVGAGRSLAGIGELSGTIQGRHAAYLMGRVHHGLGQRPEAIAAYELALSGASEDGPSWFPRAEIGLRRAVALHELGAVKPATESLARIAADGSAPRFAAHASLFGAIALLGTGKAAAADRELVRLSRAALDSDLQARALLWASRAVFQRLENAESWMAGELKTRGIDLLDQAEMIEPSDAIAGEMATSRADALLQLGQLAEAAAAYSDLAQGGSDRSLRAAYRRLVAIQLQGRHVDAIRAARDLERLHPSSRYSALLALRHADSLLQQALGSQSLDSVETYVDGAIDGFDRAIALGGVSDLDETRFRLGLALALDGRASEADALLASVEVRSGRSLTPRAVSAATTAPYFRARLLLASLDLAARDAIEAGRVLRDLEKAEKLLLEFLGVAGNDVQLRSKATLALVRCLRRRAGLLADSRQRASLLGRARGLVRTLRTKLGAQPLGAYARLEEGRVLAAAGDSSRAAQRLGSFVREIPWKDSPLAPLALLELSRMHRASGETKDADVALTAAAQRLPGRGVEGDEDGGDLRAAIEIARVERAALGGDPESASVRIAALLATGSRLLEPRLLALRLGSVRTDAETAALVASLRNAARRLENDDGDRAADIWLELAWHHAEVEEPRPLAAAIDRLLVTLEASDVRAIEARCLRALALVREGRAAEARREVEDVYASSIDGLVDDKLLLRRAACALAAGAVDDAFEQLTELGERREDLRSMIRVGLAIIASMRGDETLSAGLLGSLTGGGKGDVDKVPATFRPHGSSVAPRLATAVLDAEPADRAAVWAESLLCVPLVVESIAGSIEVDITPSSDDLLEDARRLGIAPFPIEADDRADPLGPPGRMRILPAPAMLPLLDAPPREIFRLAAAGSEEMP